MALLPFLLFLGLIAFTRSCQITADCDTACTNLKTYISTNHVTNTRYRLQYHVSTPIGWMNDPNGFIYYKGNYHIFYQYYPYASSVEGSMYWGHSTSTDLVNWSTQQTALLPGTESCFSGSAVIVGTTLVLMYTGHVVNGTVTEESQYLAFSDDGVNFRKYDNNPVLRYSGDGSPDFRDPKAWQYQDTWYVILGSKTTGGLGSVRLYSSPDLINWTFKSVIGESSATVTGSARMWECPDFFELNGKYVLLMSPQGMTVVGDRFKNLYQTGYILGSFSYDTFTFTPETEFQELDYGHDFYATQTNVNDGKRILIAWFGMWENVFPEKADGWAGALTIFRELQLSGTRILMKPVEAMDNLRGTAVHTGLLATDVAIELDATGELVVTADWTQNVNLELKGRTDGGGYATLAWDVTNKKVVVIKGADDVRQVEWAPLSTHTWRIFLDTSSVELFCGDGDVVFSSRVYPLGGWKITNLSAQSLTVTAYPLRRSVPE